MGTLAKAGSQELIFKVCFIGDWGVGKTCLFHRVATGVFPEHVEETIGQDIKIKDMTVEGIHVTLRLCDTAGQERFKQITSSYYRGANAVILVYDPCEPESLKNLKQHLEEVNRYTTDKTLQCIMCNKMDKQERKVEKEEALQFIQSLGQMGADIKLYEGSAKTSQGVDEMMNEVVIGILKQKGHIVDKKENKKKKHSSCIIT